ncbi:recombinase family protein [Allobranchiibius sp. GilTou73]|uniref:recombinase family protein n=1 Tax=Allobranchiibius sp. GilTou73 TaxID=2904523 RepID=UPI001F41FE6A|nr:recombinase family protein [Allobranchiibius sp. GilTou73]UIJ33961.1 recombinase family protein [Allobranchiibius sp. GilTou73]
MTIWGYARVSTAQQDLGPQLAALLEAGVDEAHLVTDKISGSRAGRPGLDRLLQQLQRGDVLTVWKLDRLGRSVSHLVNLVEELGERGIQFRSLTDGLDTTTKSGRFMFTVVAAMAQFERDLNQERTAAALAVLREKGVALGRPSRITRGQYEVIRNLHDLGKSERAIASSVGLSRSTVRRVIHGNIASLAKYETSAVDALPFAPVQS